MILNNIRERDICFAIKTTTQLCNINSGFATLICPKNLLLNILFITGE